MNFTAVLSYQDKIRILSFCTKKNNDDRNLKTATFDKIPKNLKHC